MSDSWIGVIGTLIGTLLGYLLQKIDEHFKKGKLIIKVHDIVAKTRVSNNSGGFIPKEIKEGVEGCVDSAFCYFYIEILNDSQIKKRFIRNFNVINNFNGEFKGCFISDSKVESIIIDPLSVVKFKVHIELNEWLDMTFKNNYIKVTFENEKFKITTIRKKFNTDTTQ